MRIKPFKLEDLKNGIVSQDCSGGGGIARKGLTDLFQQSVTVYIDVPASWSSPRRWVRKVLSRCNVQGQIVERANNTVRQVSAVKTVYSVDGGYMPPDEFYALEDQEEGFTVAAGDYVVFGEVQDEVRSQAEALALAKKYKGRMIRAGQITVYVNGMALDHIEIAEA